MAEITYRRPEVSDAKNIVDFYACRPFLGKDRHDGIAKY